MKKLKIFKINLLLICMFLLFSLLTNREARATTYYVSPTGNDSNSGLISAPFKTIQKAANVVSAGDTVYIRQGTYAGFKFTNKAGTSGSWITFKPYTGETAIINPYTDNYATTWMGVEFINSSYIEINGFEITDTNPAFVPQNDTYSQYSQGVNHDGVKLNDSDPNWSHHLKIIDNTIHSVGFHGIITSIGSSYIEILNNTIYDVGLCKRGYGAYISGNNHTISGNTVYHAYGHGIQIYNAVVAPEQIVVDRNKVYNNGHTDYGVGYPPGGFPQTATGDGIIAYNAGSNIVVRNNISYNNLQWGIRVSSYNGQVINNTSYNNGKEEIYVYDNKNVIVRNNIAMDYYIGSGNTQDHNLFGIDPKFVNPGNGNFNLQSDSPAIDKGIPAGINYDVDGNPRDSAPDIGAYEYVGNPVYGDTNPPAAPRLY